jgi:hypothetical protein
LLQLIEASCQAVRHLHLELLADVRLAIIDCRVDLYIGQFVALRRAMGWQFAAALNDCSLFWHRTSTRSATIPAGVMNIAIQSAMSALSPGNPGGRKDPR